MLCPHCGSPDQLIKESRFIREGAARRRRFLCRSCNTKWTGYFDANSDEPIGRPNNRKPREEDKKPRFRKMTEDMVVEILTSSLSDAAMAQAAGVTRQSVGFIRNGDTFRLVRPDIPRRERRNRLSSGDIQDIVTRYGEGEPVADIAFDYELPEKRILQVLVRST